VKYTVKIENRDYEVQINDLSTRPIRVTVNGDPIEVWPEEKTQTPIVQSTQPDESSSKATSVPAANRNDKKHGTTHNAIHAPIPGVIIHIAVEPGEKVEFGQDLCTLEAMKMKNAIRSAQPGVIDRVLVTVGEQVSQNQPLMTYRSEES
jgi:biotin carboxyl carrier protein